MKWIHILIAILFNLIVSETVLINPLHDLQHDTMELWSKFKEQFNKTYASTHHEIAARRAWRDNLKHVMEHNNGSPGRWNFTLAPNPFSDMTLQQYLRRIVKLVASKENHHVPSHPPQELLRRSNIPDKFDWRDVGFHPTAPWQQQCGACYAFSVTYALQAQLLQSRHMIVPLSCQQIIDCSGRWGNYGCGGGSLRNSLEYLHKMGIMSSIDYPYLGRRSRCNWERSGVIANVTERGLLPRGDEDAIQTAVAIMGPVPVSINAAPRTFQLYHSGVYDDPLCSSNHVNHAMLVVGYTPSYWILLNWWGTTWGQNGYMKLRKGVNMCGIANFAAYLKTE